MTPPHFYIFCDYLPLEEDLALRPFEQAWIPFIQGHNVYQVDWIWPAGSGEEDF